MVRKYRRGNTWGLDYREHGRRVRKTLGRVSKEDAETARLAKEFELRTGQQIYSTAPLFIELAQEYLRWHANEYPDSSFRTEQIIRQHLLPAFQYIALDQLNPLQVEAYKADRLECVARTTVAKEVRTLKAMLNKAVAWRLVANSPIVAVKAPKDSHDAPPHWYSMEALAQLYSASRLRPIWQFMANTGLRRGEALQLTWDDIHGDAVHILSKPGARTKSAKWREVPLSVNALAALDELSGGEYVLPVMAPKSLTRAFRKDRDRAGVDGSLHSLRHTFGTHMALKGAPIHVIKELMGHSTIKVTEQYMHVAQDHLKEAVRGFSI